MDRKLPAGIVRKNKIKKLSGIGGTLVVLVAGFFGLRAAISPTLDRARLLTSVAEIGPIEAAVSASGVVVPEFEQVLTAPVASTVESVSIQSGDSVHAGESILQLNTEQLQLAYQKVSDELEIEKNKKQQLTLELVRKQADLKASHDIKVLQEQFVASKHDRAKHLFEIGGITRADLDLAALDLEITKRELKQLADQVANQEASIDAAQRELDLQISVQQNRQSEIQRQLDLAAARAGRSGILTWVNADIGAPVNPGDVIARVADLSSFKVEASISDIHAGKLGLGGAVNVRIGNVTLTGRIGSVRPAVQNGVVTFVVLLDDKSDASLRPNLRTEVYVITSIVDNVVRVKNGPFYNGSTDQKIFVMDGDKAVGKIVNIGVSNYDWVEIQGDVQPGEAVIVSDTKKYRHMDEVAIRGE
jgi:HlyD family secretion protein